MFDKMILLESQGKLPKLYHISFRDNLEGVWEPRNPDGMDGETDGGTDGEKTDISEPDISEPDFPRISFSPTIKQCFQAIYPNVWKYFEEKNFPYMEFFVYSPRLSGRERVLTPRQLTERRFVHDAHVTEEHCVLDKVFMERIARIRVLNTNKERRTYYHPFNSKQYDRWRLAPSVVRFEVMEVFSGNAPPRK